MPPDLNPTTVGLAELRARLQAAPFVPFIIVTSGGKTYEVPTPDRLTISRLLRRVSVEHDDGSAAYINLLHVSSIEPQPNSCSWSGRIETIWRHLSVCVNRSTYPVGMRRVSSTEICSPSRPAAPPPTA